MSGAARGPVPARFTADPLDADGRAVLEQGHHAVLGVSPGNSYFNVALLTGLLGWLRGRFARVDAVVPDSALEYTYLALGYDAKRAAKKARGETNVLRNRVLRAWEATGGLREGDGLHRMSDFTGEELYRQKHTEAERALEEDPLLRDTCVRMSREVLAVHGHTGRPGTEALDLAVRYLVAELPFFVASAEIFGVPSSLNFYHQPLPLAELVFSGGSVLKAPPWQGYATVRPADSDVDHP